MCREAGFNFKKKKKKLFTNELNMYEKDSL